MEEMKAAILQILINAAEFADEIDPADVWRAIGEDPRDHLSDDAIQSGDW